MSESSQQWLEDFRAEVKALERPRLQAFEDERVRLGVTAQITTSMSPLQIEGVVDARSFYLRERGGEYELWLSPASDPMVCLRESTGLFDVCDVISGGSDDELYGQGDDYYAAALREVTNAIRTHLGRDRQGREGDPQ